MMKAFKRPNLKQNQISAKFVVKNHSVKVRLTNHISYRTFETIKKKGDHEYTKDAAQ